MANNLPVVSITNGVVTTLSTDVAAFFEKRHDLVLRAIETQCRDLDADRLRNFAETVVTRANPSGGAPIQSKAYRLTRDGFTFLAMGFTGAKAQAFKWMYIDAFNRMEEQLRGNNVAACPATITPAEQLKIQQAVAHRAKTSSANYQTIYRAIKVRFQIPRYNELPRCQFAECLKFIDAVDLKVPETKATAKAETKTAAPVCENPFTPEELAASPEKPPKGYAYRVTAEFLEQQRIFIYHWRYLFRRELELFDEFLYRTKSPYAGRFHEAVHDLNLMGIEDQLRRLGFPMDGLPCYRHYVGRLAAA